MGRYSGKTCRLSTMLMLTGSFFLAEIIVGYVTNSIALIADSFHMLSDVVAVIVAFASVRISKWPSKRNTYGWVRAEILGALVNAVFLLALCFSILVEAIKRLVIFEEVERPVLLLIVGAAGLLVNCIGLLLFGHHGHSHGGGGHGHAHGGGGHSNSHGDHGHSHGGKSKLHDRRAGDSNHVDLVHSGKDIANGHGASAQESEKLVGNHVSNSSSAEREMDKTVYTMQSDHEIFIAQGTDVTVDFKKPELASASQLNMRGVFIHVLGDALGSVIVIISALVIKFTEGQWKHYVDPAVSIVMVAIILATAVPLLKESAFILLQTVPSHVDVENIIKELEQMEGIYGVHECHIWQLAGSRIVASAHIRCHGIDEYMELASRIKHVFHNAGIHSTTIQPEFVDWQSNLTLDQACALVCPSDGEQCAPNTCCGDKDKTDKAQTTGGNPAQANQNNSFNVSAAADVEVDTLGEIAAADGNPRLRPVNKNPPGVSGFTSIHSLDVKFSPDGDEVVLEMSDMGHADNSGHKRTK